MNIETREWLDDDGCFKFGKCKGEHIEDVAKSDPSYLRWIVESVEDINHEDRDVIETALQFRRR